MRAGLAASVVALFALGLGGMAGGGTSLPLRAGPAPMTSIEWTSPMDGETDVPVNAPIRIGFRDLDVTTFSLSYTITPAVSGVSVVIWWTSDIIVVILHDPFAICTEYTVAITSPNLDPGPVPNPWSFTTECAFVPAQNLTIERL